ncbi:MAG: cyclase family protein, partial [Anaerolineaceae bacterium]|nr:cyclase family protein [Anaerolineaceae bacterium]
IEGGADLDSLDLDRLIGLAIVVEVPDSKKVIDREFLEDLHIEQTQRVLFKTSNSKLWQDPQQVFYKDYVAVDPSGAKWLVEHGCELVGIDYLSIAPYDQSKEPHEILLSNGVIVLESINLDQVPAGAYELICLPLKLNAREASPVRAILKIIE